MEIKRLEAHQLFQEERFTKKVLFQADGTIIFTLNFMPGQQLPVHRHPGSQVYVLVVQGGGTMIVDGVETEVRQGDCVRCGGEESFAFANTGQEPATLYVNLNSIPDERFTREI
ncbi:cupin domain-containing protein [Paenibacillus oleatilyticus]|uniref:cupin domain-containing protein n=1 Tax=Paenibacillus oleatilyticus TaxID=2594886 RepID=UPI001C1F672C|nr:cupin domain-containing protein [Paenibacillus oleatilyticus]MBU7314929.1 cupin domain-containing protein [Paenibacillus oleatilyticus]